MAIQTDAAELLVKIYEKKVSGAEIGGTIQSLLETRWSALRINLALEYLQQKKFIEGTIHYTNSVVQRVVVRNITPDGIDIVENPENFKKAFSLGGGLLSFLPFSWGASEANIPHKHLIAKVKKLVGKK